MIIGMDFGTTNSGVAVYDGQQVRFIPIDPASPSRSIARTALYLTNDRQVYIGRSAIDTYYQQNLNRPVNISKVRVGEITLTFAELPSFVRDVYIEKDIYAPGRLFLSFKMALSSLNYLGTVVGSNFYFLEDIIALYLFIAKRRAETHLDTEITDIVLGRPVRFAFDAEADHLARERLLKAAFRAGYQRVYLQYEPIAAAYHYEQSIDRAQNVLIFDFGGGTLDISILRVGDPKQRRVLANGGVPIAGDVFDQKIVRAKLPKHFGEGTYYRVGQHMLPVPSSFYEAFSNWQEMLSLQSPELFEDLKRIEIAAEQPRQIRALRDLISSSYGLKMYDVVETAKRQLSDNLRATIRLEGTDFQVYEPITRSDFERIIRPEVRQIEAYLDTMLSEAGLKAEDIDTVIRTGGSSQIPVFVELLEQRFGAEKVRSVDTFSSVTSGLGIIAHQLERGELDLTSYRYEDYAIDDRVEGINGVPAVNFNTMKKFIALTETGAKTANAVGLVGLTAAGQVVAAVCDELEDETPLTALGLPSDLDAVITAAADEPLCLSTSDYRLTLKTPHQLAALQTVGLGLADAEGFQTDVFGDEYVSGITRWSPLRDTSRIVLLTTTGHYKVFAETLIERVEQPVPYSTARLKGYPVTLVSADEEGEIVVFTATGRAIRLPAALLNQANGRAVQVSTKDRVIAAFGVNEVTRFLLATAKGELSRVDSDALALEIALNTNGEKVITARSLQSVVPFESGQVVRMMTDTRITTIDPTLHQLRLHKGERLISLSVVHP